LFNRKTDDVPELLLLVIETADIREAEARIERSNCLRAVEHAVASAEAHARSIDGEGKEKWFRGAVKKKQSDNLWRRRTVLQVLRIWQSHFSTAFRDHASVGSQH
jgi:hypothetical protein